MPKSPSRASAAPVTVIGLGAVGSSLARAFREAGCRRLTLVGKGRKRERALARSLKAAYLARLDKLHQQNGYVILAVPDSAVLATARRLSRLPLPWPKLTVLHTSGPLGPDMLALLERAGAAVAAWHPYQTFPHDASQTSLAGVTFGITGKPKAVRAGFALARALGGRPLRIADADRVLYHASAVMACGFVAANLKMAVDVLHKIGLSEKRALEAVTAIGMETLCNVIELGLRSAQTGPAVRGDARTLRAHIKALRGLDPKLAHVYEQLSKFMLNTART